MAKLHGEQWCVVEGWPYEVSSLGRVRSIRYNKILSNRCVNGYRTVSFCVNYQTKDFLVHRLMLTVFKSSPPFSGAQARHLDDNKTNLNLDNLAWGTHQDNVEDKIRNGIQVGKLSKDQLAYIKKIYPLIRGKRGKLKELASKLGVNPATVSNVVGGRQYKVPR